MIIQVLINLVKNAIQAVEGVDQPSVRVLAKMNSGRVVMEVIDNGPGIPEDIREEIFVPFFTTRDQGSGVGLSYSRQVMNLNRGRIEFESSPGNTCFRLIF